MAEVKCLLAEAADISRHEPAIITADRRLLYHEFEERVLFATVHLRAAGVGRGARVAIWLENDWRHLVLLPALMRIGAVAVALNVRLAPRDLLFIIQHSECRVIFVDAHFLDEDEVHQRPSFRIAAILGQPA